MRNIMAYTTMLNRMYGMLGRVLAYACLFEDQVQKVSATLKLKKHPDIRGENQVRELYQRIHKKSLSTNLKSWNINNEHIWKILCSAREARNKMAHEVPRRLMEVSLDNNQMTDAWEEQMYEYFRCMTIQIAQGNLIMYRLQYALSDTKDTYNPSDKYPEIVADWVLYGPAVYEVLRMLQSDNKFDRYARTIPAFCDGTNLPKEDGFKFVVSLARRYNIMVDTITLANTNSIELT